MSRAIKLKWVTLCAYFQKQLPDVVIEMYFQDVSDLPESDVLNALDTWRLNPKNRSVPLPSQIRDMIDPVSFDEDSVARETIASILQAIDKFGYASPDLAKEFIGSLGWSVVRVYGGWESLCRSLGDTISLDTFNAQARELVKSRAKYGDSIMDYAKQLEYGQKNQEYSQIGQLQKLLQIKTIE